MEEVLKEIAKTSEYLDYIREHYLHVQKAWGVLSDKCADMRFISDDFFYFTIDKEVKFHDLSKLSENEFVQYRKAFYPTTDEPKYDMASAWDHHKKNNAHHWENWTLATNRFHPDEWEIHCVHMVIDWMAMGYKFGDSAKSYYEKNKHKINIPGYGIRLIYEIFSRIEA